MGNRPAGQLVKSFTRLSCNSLEMKYFTAYGGRGACRSAPPIRLHGASRSSPESSIARFIPSARRQKTLGTSIVQPGRQQPFDKTGCNALFSRGQGPGEIGWQFVIRSNDKLHIGMHMARHASKSVWNRHCLSPGLVLRSP